VLFYKYVSVRKIDILFFSRESLNNFIFIVTFQDSIFYDKSQILLWSCNATHIYYRIKKKSKETHFSIRTNRLVSS